MATREMGFVQAKKYDLEVWAPGVERWLEVSSCSNFRDYQARRMAIRYRPGAGRQAGARPHAQRLRPRPGPRSSPRSSRRTSRPTASIRVPEVLRPYLGRETLYARWPVASGREVAPAAGGTGPPRPPARPPHPRPPSAGPSARRSSPGPRRPPIASAPSTVGIPSGCQATLSRTSSRVAADHERVIPQAGHGRPRREPERADGRAAVDEPARDQARGEDRADGERPGVDGRQLSAGGEGRSHRAACRWRSG